MYSGWYLWIRGPCISSVHPHHTRHRNANKHIRWNNFGLAEDHHLHRHSLNSTRADSISCGQPTAAAASPPHILHQSLHLSNWLTQLEELYQIKFPIEGERKERLSESSRKEKDKNNCLPTWGPHHTTSPPHFYWKHQVTTFLPVHSWVPLAGRIIFQHQHHGSGGKNRRTRRPVECGARV